MKTPPLTQDYIRRINQAIAECDRYIAKEEPRRADIRPASAAELLEVTKSHRAKLVAMLQPGVKGRGGSGRVA